MGNRHIVAENMPFLTPGNYRVSYELNHETYEIEEGIRRILSNGMVSLNFQPIILGLKDCTIVEIDSIGNISINKE